MKATTIIAALVSTSLALPTTSNHSSREVLPRTSLNKRADPVAQLTSIMPKASSCAGADQAKECATAKQAVGPLIDSFNKYKVLTAPEQAALLSWIAYESAELRYNQNHFPAPGRPGQGTRNMMMPNFVAKYVASIPELASKAGSDPAATLALVQSDKYSFASAAWFYSTQCSATIKQGVKTGGKAGWTAFITSCVQTTMDSGREGYWTAASKALFVPGV